jgi:exonuclease III
MRIVSWNCKFGFNAEKAKFIKKYKADLYVIQECSEKDLDEVKTYFNNQAFYCDYLDSKYGVGMFSDKFDFEILPEHDKTFRYIVPYRVFNSESEFVLFSIWTKDKDENYKKIGYTEQVWKAINFEGYDKYFTDSIILVGDFNSNNFWDKKYIEQKQPSHNDIIKKLKEYGVESAYHKFNNCADGAENDATLLWIMNKNNKYHIDYCFISNNYKLNNVNIGSIKEWEENKLSDHCPLIIDIE